MVSDRRNIFYRRSRVISHVVCAHARLDTALYYKTLIGLALFNLMYNNVSLKGLHLPRKYRKFQLSIKTLYPEKIHIAGVV